VLFFLEEMNKTAEKLGLKHTMYDSPHGLSNTQNKSSALDISKLTTKCMQMKKFREIVCTKFFTVKKNTNGNRKTYKWYNTHMMLGQRGINGVKTGITPNAGPCLCTSIWNEDFEITVVILNTKNCDIRWPETWKLANWAMTRMKTIAKFQQAQDANDPIQHKRLLNRIRHL
jgi:D-alanyl-D-alanine carboxypeptidase